MGLKIAVIGATGNVGREMLTVLEERAFPADDVVAIASRRSQGTEVSFGDRVLKVQALENYDFRGTDIALMSAGVVVSGGLGLLQDPVVIGVFFGLVVGKPIGVLGGAFLVTRFTRAELNRALSWRDVVGVAVLAGIGFTVSLLVADLSFVGAERDAAKTAVLAGSLVSAVLGALMLGHRDRFHITP